MLIDVFFVNNSEIFSKNFKRFFLDTFEAKTISLSQLRRTHLIQNLDERKINFLFFWQFKKKKNI